MIVYAPQLPEQLITNSPASHYVGLYWPSFTPNLILVPFPPKPVFPDFPGISGLVERKKGRIRSGRTTTGAGGGAASAPPTPRQALQVLHPRSPASQEGMFLVSWQSQISCLLPLSECGTLSSGPRGLGGGPQCEAPARLSGRPGLWSRCTGLGQGQEAALQLSTRTAGTLTLLNRAQLGAKGT